MDSLGRRMAPFNRSNTRQKRDVMKHSIVGTTMPVLQIQLDQGDKIIVVVCS